MLACERGPDGKYYARELVMEQTLDNLWAFSERLDKAHDRIVEAGRCKCPK